MATKHKSSTEPAFRWSDVAVGDRDWLQKRTQDIETYTYRTACDMVRIGQTLAEIRDRLPRKFSPWLVSQTPFSKATAYRLIATAGTFAPYVSLIETVEPYALYLLSQQDAPQAAREHAVQLASQGEKVTRALALSILDAYSDEDPSEEEVEEYERLKGRIEQEENGRDKVTERLETMDAALYEGVGRTVIELVERVSMLTITKLDELDDAAIYSVTCHENGKPRSVVDRNLHCALELMAGREPQKYCPGCCEPGETLAMSRFGVNKSMPDGLMARCKVCERERKKDMKKAQRAVLNAHDP